MLWRFQLEFTTYALLKRINLKLYNFTFLKVTHFKYISANAPLQPRGAIICFASVPYAMIYNVPKQGM